MAPKFMIVYPANLLNIEHNGQTDAKKAEVFFKQRDCAILIDLEKKEITMQKGDTSKLEAHARTKGWL